MCIPMATIIEPITQPSIQLIETPKEAKPNRQPKKKTLAGKFGHSALMLVRRVHLYSGIFMFPWVLLYGFTGWFFNHPRMLTGDDVTTFAAADAPNDLLTNLPTATETAKRVVDEMNLESFFVGGPEIKLSMDRKPAFHGFLSYNVNTDEATHQVTINPVTGSGEVRTTHAIPPLETPESEQKINPIADIRSVTLPDGVVSKVQSGVPQILDELGLPSGDAFTGRRSASLVFAAEADGVPCIITYSLASGGITSVRADDRPTMEAKSFLQRLHLARTYSPSFDVRWVWALLVDAMFVSMVFWGVSGLMMWWQVKRTRLMGGGVLLASIVFAGLMAFNMHDSLTTGGGRGGGNHGGGNHGRGGGEAPAMKATSTQVPPSLAAR